MPVLPLADHVTPQSALAAAEPCVLLKLGEIVLKGKNRQRFERLLHENIRHAVADLGIPLRLWQRDGVIVLTIAGGRPGSRPAGRRPKLPAGSPSRWPRKRQWTSLPTG